MMENVQLVTVLVLIGSLVVAILQLWLLRRQIKAQHDWNRRVTALKYSFSDDPRLRKIRSRLERELGVYKAQELSHEQIEQLKETSPDLIVDIHFVLGRLAGMCAAMNNRIIDEKVCKDLLQGTVINFHRFFRQFIDETRDVRGNPEVYKCLESYAMKWESQAAERKQRSSTG